MKQAYFNKTVRVLIKSVAAITAMLPMALKRNILLYDTMVFKKLDRMRKEDCVITRDGTMQVSIIILLLCIALELIAIYCNIALI